MWVILGEGILKVVFVLIDELSGFGLVVGGENRRCVIFGLYEKHGEKGKINMVDLGGGGGGGNNEIVKLDIGFLMEMFSD